ncbi:uncharacterized protein LOC112565889 isoform X2 [Pomacea canaliculata]|uniref:uncharacterized protein LOC112565889 isoform X2 n=1 Tax=Pomacea canaliculata TaxID=400727 RepID=UPI000D73D002|nr:uncharacterized protein LOC112565889 isoform X2 [Pomacea canaliculata]
MLGEVNPTFTKNGFQTLKNLVPKFETSGRESKADILFKAVEYSRKLQRECTEQGRQLEELRAERETLNDEIEHHQTSLPEGQLFEDQPLTADQRLDHFIHSRCIETWHFWIFGFFMRPLHSSYKNVDCATADAFVNSVVNWAKQNLSSANLRSVALESLRNISIQTSIMTSPETLSKEAREHCRRTVAREHVPTSTETCRQQVRRHDDLMISSSSHSRRGCFCLHSAVTEFDKAGTLCNEHSCSEPTEMLQNFDDITSYDSSTSMDTTSSDIESAFQLVDKHSLESSTLSLCLKTSPLHMKIPKAIKQDDAQQGVDQDTVIFDNYESSATEEEIKTSLEVSPLNAASSSYHCPNPLLEAVGDSRVNEPALFESFDTQYLLESAGCQLQSKITENHCLLEHSDHQLLDTAVDSDHPFDLSMLDYDVVGDLPLSCYMML